jgi:hypothetical protein
LFIEVEGHERIYAIADEDLERENAEKTSAVHFFDLSFRLRRGLRCGRGRASSSAATTRIIQHMSTSRSRRWLVWRGI